MTEPNATEQSASVTSGTRNKPNRPFQGFKGTRLVPAAAALKQSGISGASFLISNRTLPSDVNDTQPVPGGAMNWYLSNSQINDPDPANYIAQGQEPTVSAPSAFRDALISALGAQADPRLTLFLHGLGTTFDAAIQGTSAIGANLLEFAQYPGLVVGFDWPSYDETGSIDYYAPSTYAFPLSPSITSGTVRGNINGTANNDIAYGPCAFANILTFLSDLRDSVDGLEVSLLCHSEGNYVAMLGLLGSSTRHFEHILLVAADINTGAMQLPNPEVALAAQGQGISRSGIDVTVYWTTADDVLPASIATFSSLTENLHNPIYGGRLGLSGPEYGSGAQQDNMYSVDCSQVINVGNVQYLQSPEGHGVVPKYGVVDGARYDINLHSSYFYIPQILQDMAATLIGEQPTSISNRYPAADPRAFFIALNNSNNVPCAGSR